ncbi:MAG: phospholipase D-like domain-containing protein [Anaerolineae bacterium]
MTQLVWNASGQTVADLLGELASNARRILIAVAFLSKDGWTIAKDWLQDSLDRGCHIELFVGTDFYRTDPPALREAEALLRDKTGCALWICRRRSKSVFHPKLYVFESDSEIVAVVGSANLTSGGLRDNREVCCISSMALDSATAKQLETIFVSYRSDKDIHQATVLDIARYENKWTRFHHHMKKAKREADKEIKALPSIREDELKRYLKEYLSCEKEQEDYKHRMRKYDHIPAVLDRLMTAKTRAEFLEIYEQLVGKRGQRGLWYSGNLFRNKNRVADGFLEVCAMIRMVREYPEASATELFELGKPYVGRVTGLGVNVLTEVMNSYYPDQCPVLNNNSLSSLRHLAIGRFPEPQSFDAKDYQRFTEILYDLRTRYGFKSMGHVDHFLSFVYFYHVKPDQAKP